MRRARVLAQQIVYGMGLHLPRPYYQQQLQRQLQAPPMCQDALTPPPPGETGLHTARHYHPTTNIFQATLAEHPLRVDNNEWGPLFFDGWLLIQPSSPIDGPRLEGPYDINTINRYPTWSRGLRLLRPSEWLSTWTGCTNHIRAEQSCRRSDLDPSEQIDGKRLVDRYGFYIYQGPK